MLEDGNPALVSTPKNKTRRRLSKTVEQTGKAAAEATADALAKNQIDDQARLELALFDDAEPLAEDIPASRENPGEDGYHLRYLRRLIGQFCAHEVSRSAVQTAPSYALSIAAEVIGWAARDPEFKDPKNPIPHLHQVGIFDVWNAELTQDEALWIDRAAARDRVKVEEEVRRIFGAAAPPGNPMSSAALMGMARIADPECPLARIDWDRARTAHAIVESNEVAFVSSTLGLGEKDRRAAEATLSFLKHCVDDEAIRNFEQSVPFGLIRMMIDDLEPAANEPEDWVPRFCEKIQVLAEQLAPVVRSEEVFFALTRAAFEHSFAQTKFDEMDAVRRANATHKRNWESIDDAVASGLPFKIRSDGMAILEDDPEYHLIAQHPMTRETYMGTSTSSAGAAQEPSGDAHDEADRPSGSEHTATEIEKEDVETDPIDGSGQSKMAAAPASPESEAAEDLSAGNGSDTRGVPASKGVDSAPRDGSAAPAGEPPAGDQTVHEVSRPNQLTRIEILPAPRPQSRERQGQRTLFDTDDKDMI